MRLRDQDSKKSVNHFPKPVQRRCEITFKKDHFERTHADNDFQAGLGWLGATPRGTDVGNQGTA